MGQEMANILGGAGNDRLAGTAERDYVAGGGGNDTIDSGAGNDWIEGGAGGDTFVFTPGCGWDGVGDFSLTDGDRIDLRGWSGIRSLSDLTVQSDGADTLLVFSPTDSVRLIGVPAGSLTAAQFLFAGGPAGGGPGSSTGGGTTAGRTLTGTAGRDYLIGGDGADTITMGGGYDYAEGGAGSDLFALAPGDSWDYIQDFQAGAGGDVLDLRAWTGIRSLADLTITSDADGTSLTFGPNDGVRLNGVAAGTLSASNILFAPPAGSNQAPVAQGRQLATNEDTPLSGQLSATDPDSGPQGLTYRLVENGAPQHGAVTVNADGSFAYTPGKDYFGADRFTFQVTDSGGLSSTASVELTVNRQRDDHFAYFMSGRDLYRVSLDQPDAKPEALPALSAQFGPSGVYQLKIVGDTLFAAGYYDILHAFDLNDLSLPAREKIMGGGITVSGDTIYSVDDSKLYSYDLTRPGDAPAVLADFGAWVEETDSLSLQTTESTVEIIGDTLFLTSSRQSYMGSEMELVRIDLGNPGAGPVRTDLFPGNLPQPPTIVRPNSSSANQFTEAGGNLYFVATMEGAGRELYRIDGNDPWGTPTLVKDLYPGLIQEERAYYDRYSSGPVGTYTYIEYNSSGPQNLREAGGDLFFTAFTPESGVELYRLDADQPGAVPTMITDLMAGTGSSAPTDLMGTEDALYFFATTPEGRQFMRYDLASGSTSLAGIDWSGFGSDPSSQITYLVAITA